jgi:hypothetical protein
MRKSCSFPDFCGPGWPSPDELKKYFSAGGSLWASHGNDNWALRAEGLYGTAVLPRSDAVTVDLRMMGSPDHGVTLDFARWHGRIRRLDRYCAVGDPRRLGQFMVSLQGDPYSLGFFIPFEAAFRRGHPRHHRHRPHRRAGRRPRRIVGPRQQCGVSDAERKARGGGIWAGRGWG